MHADPPTGMNELGSAKTDNAPTACLGSENTERQNPHPGVIDLSSAGESGRYSIIADSEFALVGRRIYSWTARGASSVLQQGLFAGAHFVMNVLLARWLAPSAYGAFALAYAVFLLLLMSYSASFCEPIMVYGSSRYADAFPAYIRIVLRAHFLIPLPLILLMACATPLLGRFYTHDFQVAFLVLSLSSPFLLLIWLCRSAFYAQLNPHAGTIAGACYFVLLISLVSILRHYGALSPATAVGCMALSALAVSAGCLYRFRPRGTRLDPVPEWKSTHIMADHWRYGRWSTLTAFAAWIPTNIFYLILPERFGLESTAALRALMNLMYPLLQSVSALVILLIPVLVRQLTREGPRKVKRTTVQLVSLFVPVAVLYFLFLAMFGTRILRFLYAGRYSDISTWAVLAVGSVPITSGVIGLLGAALRALDLPRLVFWGCLASAILALTLGAAVTLRYGVTGATYALVFDDVPAVALLTFFLVRFKGPAEAQVDAI